LSGALTLAVEGEEYTLRAGDRDYLPAWTVHEARVEGAEPVVYLVGAKY
jgi:quercetin dioxygenase-like cupin family protein